MKEDHGLDLADEHVKKMRTALRQQFETNYEVMFKDEYAEEWTKAEKVLKEERWKKYESIQDIQAVIRKLVLTNTRELCTQTEEAVWNDIPDKLRYEFCPDKDESENGGVEGAGIRPGVYEASDDSSVKERRQEEAR